MCFHAERIVWARRIDRSCDLRLPLGRAPLTAHTAAPFLRAGLKNPNTAISRVPAWQRARSAREPEETMSKRRCWNHTPSFKAKVEFAAIKGETAPTQLAKHFDVHPNHDLEGLC